MSIKANVLLTGATGFVGSALLEFLLSQNNSVTVIARTPVDLQSPNLDVLLIGDLQEISELGSSTSKKVSEKLQNIDCVVHCAGLAHNLNKSKAVASFYQINRDVTAALATLAADAGIKRFIFISTIGVNGNETKSALSPDLPEYFTESDIPNPHNDYALSKLQAESLLQDISRSSAMEVTIIRPPLIYGENAKGNFALLEKIISKNIPLPLANITNQRSLLALDNLIDFIDICISHPAAANQTFLVADADTTSTPELLRQVAYAIGRKAILFPFPLKLLTWAAKMFGQRQIVVSLFGSLQINASKAKKVLGWQPVTTISKQLVSKLPNARQ